MSTAVGWAPIVKSEKRADGTLVITGRAASSAVDRDYQIADEAWLDKALGRWFGEPDGGNIREQHDGKRAVGTAVSYKADGHEISALIVDPITVAKIEHNVLKGFSWSARNARVKMDKAAAGGRIVDGDIYEVSVVDRPANPECLFTVAKADGNGELHVVEEPEFVDLSKIDGGTADVTVTDGPLTVKGKKVTPGYVAELMKALGKAPQPQAGQQIRAQKSDDDGDGGDGGDGKAAGHQPKRYKASDGDTVTCPSCGRKNAPDAKHCDQCGYKLKGNPDVQVDSDSDGSDGSDASKVDSADDVIAKRDMDPNVGGGVDRDKLKNSDFVFGDERAFPVVTAGDVPDAVSSWGRYKGKHSFAEFKKNLTALAKRKGFEGSLPDKWVDTKKAVDAVGALTKALGEHGIEMSKVDAEAAEQEGEDISDSKAAIAAIARLIIAEAEELAEGHLCEIDDIQMLISAACALQCFIYSEADEIGSHAAPTEVAPMKTDTVDTDTQTTADNTSVTEKTDAAQGAPVTEKDLSELLDAAITKAVQPYKDELALVKADLAKVLETPRTDGPARTRTTTHTAVAAKADAARSEIAALQQMVNATGGAIQKGYRERLENAQAELDKLTAA